jgi:hypothetical protein
MKWITHEGLRGIWQKQRDGEVVLQGIRQLITGKEESDSEEDMQRVYLVD